MPARGEWAHALVEGRANLAETVRGPEVPAAEEAEDELRLADVRLERPNIFEIVHLCARSASWARSRLSGAVILWARASRKTFMPGSNSCSSFLMAAAAS